MYIRFVTDIRDDLARTEMGIFQSGWPNRVTDWRITELQREYDWFNRHLAVPRRFHMRPGRKGHRAGVCWFRPEATEHITRARYIAWLLSDMGVPVTELRNRDPGTRLWQDTHQIVALTDRRAPNRLH
ncbi:hypothetical protein [Actibacterium ureilyticum]|uniref:hypothetical protein n=1 Tax=Actibacterium ureilyticum TaxID=1590614 RepID=UPI000BAAA073|nr:hypothetical protein [Actibacterium ureilyticum]